MVNQITVRHKRWNLPYLTGLWQSLQKPRDIRGIDLDARCGELSTDLLRDGWQQNPFLTRNLLRHCLPARGYSHCMRKCSCPSVLQACWLSHCEGNTQDFSKPDMLMVEVYSENLYLQNDHAWCTITKRYVTPPRTCRLPLLKIIALTQLAESIICPVFIPGMHAVHMTLYSDTNRSSWQMTIVRWGEALNACALHAAFASLQSPSVICWIIAFTFFVHKVEWRVPLHTSVVHGPVC